MITRLSVTNPNVLVSPLTYDAAGSASMDEVQIREIDGLHAVDADLNFTPYGTVDGANYTGGFVGVRTITLTLGFNPDMKNMSSVSSLRNMLYTYFMPKSTVDLLFTRNDGPNVHIEGIVEACEANAFAQDPEMIVTVRCRLPYFRCVTTMQVSGNVLTSAQNIIDNWEFFEYTGNVPAGFALEITNNGTDIAATTDWTISAHSPQQTTFSIVNMPLLSGQTIKWSSNAGDKYFEKSDGTSLLAYTSGIMEWPLLYPGPNLFGISFNSASTSVSWKMTYCDLWGGI